MKSQISRIITLFLVLGYMIMVTGCRSFGTYVVKNERADDKISQVIYDQLGTKMCYHDRYLNTEEQVQYYFYIVNDYEDENLLVDMAETVNNKLKEDRIHSRICLVIWEVIPGGTRTMVCLSNYYENDSEYESYETLQCLDIRGTHGEDELYNEVSTYENLKDIKALILEVDINESMEEEGVDWYEIWPDLEHFDIYNEVDRTRTQK